MAGAQEGFRHTLGALRLVVPLHVIADDLCLHLRGVNPVDPGPPVAGVQRSGAAEHEHGSAAQRGFVDSLAGMLQADNVVHYHVTDFGYTRTQHIIINYSQHFWQYL